MTINAEEMTVARKGRPEMHPLERKSRQFSVRLPPILRNKLTAAASNSGRTLSAEIEARLLASFGETGRMQAEFGGPAAAYLFRQISRQIPMLQRLNGGHRWFEDKWTFCQLEKVMNDVFRYWEPTGSGSAPPNLRNMRPEPGHQLASAALAEAGG